MKVTQNAADQARAAYGQTTDQLGNLGLDTAVPEGVRALAEKAVAQTREACDRSLDALDASLTRFERTFDAAGQGVVAFNRKIVDLAQCNVDATFNLATRLAGAKDLAGMVELQAAFRRKQFGMLTAQAEEVRARSTRVTAAAPSRSTRKCHAAGRASVLSHPGTQARQVYRLPKFATLEETRWMPRPF